MSDDTGTVLMYDLGMYDGADTAHYLDRGFRVVAVEANPALVAEARTRFERPIADGRLTVVNKAISMEGGGTLEFWVNDRQPHKSSTDRHLAGRAGNVRSVSVESATLLELFSEYGRPEALKIDIECDASEILGELEPRDAPKFLSIELGAPADLDLLRKCGYRHFKLVSQFSYTPLDYRQSAHFGRLSSRACIALMHVQGAPGRVLSALQAKRLAMRVLHPPGSGGGWTFSRSSSGPLGTTLDGPWSGFDEVRSLAEECVFTKSNGSARTEDEIRGLWVDVHATTELENGAAIA